MYRGTIIDELIAAVAKIEDQKFGEMLDGAEILGDCYHAAPVVYSTDISLAGVA
jgi:hypothetical protein